MNGSPMVGIERRLGTLRGRIRGLHVLDWTGRLLIGLGGFITITFVLDFFLVLPSALRLIFLAAGIGGLGILTFRRLLRPLAVPIRDDDLALLVERGREDLDDRLISALQLWRTRGRDPEFNSPELIDALVMDTVERTQGMEFSRVLHTPASVWRAALLGGLISLVLGGLAVRFPEEAGIYARRALGFSTPWPQVTWFKVLGFDEKSRETVIARGDNLEIVVAVEGRRPTSVNIEYELLDSGEEGSEEMEPWPDQRFKFRFDQVLEPIRFRITSRGAATEDYYVRVQNPPSLKEPELFFVFPEYLKKGGRWKDTPPDQPVRGPAIEVPLYTRVRFRTASDTEVQEAELKIGPRKNKKIVEIIPKPDAAGRKRILEGEFTVEHEAGEYSLHARGLNGLWNRDPFRYQIKGLPDRPPVIEVERPRFSIEEVTAQCQKEIHLRARDDHAIAALGMLYRTRLQGEYKTKMLDPDRDRPILEAGKVKWIEKTFGIESLVPRGYGKQHLQVFATIDFREFALSVGDQVEIRFFGEDYKNIGPRNRTRTRSIYTFKIVAVSALEKKLEEEIGRIKRALADLHKDQERYRRDTERLRNKFLDPGKPFSRADAREVRRSSLDQNGITERLSRLHDQVRYVHERGIENRIFDKRSAGALEQAVALLKGLVDDSTVPPGASYSAAQHLRSASREKDPRARGEFFARAYQEQTNVLDTVDRVIRALDKWSSYQEVVRMARELYESMIDTRRKIEERRRCPDCRKGEVCPIHR